MVLILQRFRNYGHSFAWRLILKIESALLASLLAIAMDRTPVTVGDLQVEALALI